MKKIAFILIVSMLCTSLFADDIEKNSALFEKWGKEYKVGSEVLKKLSEIFSGEENYSQKFDNETVVGIMGIPDWELTSGKEFLKGKTLAELSSPDLNIRVAAYNLNKCVESYGPTSTALRCYSESLEEEGAAIMAKMIAKSRQTKDVSELNASIKGK